MNTYSYVLCVGAESPSQSIQSFSSRPFILASSLSASSPPFATLPVSFHPHRVSSHISSIPLSLSLSLSLTHTHTHILPHRSRTTTSETTTCLPSNHASWTVTPKVSCARKYSSTKSCLSLLKLYLEIVIECGECWGVAFIRLPPSTPPPPTLVPLSHPLSLSPTLSLSLLLSLARPGTMQ